MSHQAPHEHPFPDKLKLAEVNSTFKKDDPLGKENYRQISLSHRPKIFEKILLKLINGYLEPKQTC